MGSNPTAGSSPQAPSSLLDGPAIPPITGISPKFRTQPQQKVWMRGRREKRARLPPLSDLTLQSNGRERATGGDSPGRHRNPEVVTVISPLPLLIGERVS
ncbi:MAG: hypothetical protein AB7T14_08830 [Candidatus Methylacidiphilaceae bacterium]